MKWAHSHSANNNCYWITGGPAVGKSTIAAKLTETFKDKKILYAQYFVNRNIGDSTDLDNVLPTMAHQLAENSPLAAVTIQDMLNTTPIGDVKELSNSQAQALLVEPLRAIANKAPKVTVVVVIDGIDELANADPSVLSRVTSVLCSVMSDLPPNVKILIFSRPEHWITTKIPDNVKQLKLATTSKDSQHDADLLIRAKFEELTELHEWKGWPSEDQVSLLCRLAAGHLGLASTALSWIARELKSEGNIRRDKVIEEVSEKGMKELDGLYAFILRRILPEDLARKEIYLNGLKSVLGCLAVLQEPLDIDTISTLLSLSDFDVQHCMKQISSLIFDGIESQRVPKLHQSVVDFLVNSRPDSDFHIDLTKQHHSLTTICFKSIRRLTFNVGHITSSHRPYEKISISQSITYPCRWFGSHLEDGGQRTTLESDVENFMKTDFLLWLEVLSLQGLVESVAVSTLEILEKWIEVSIHLFKKYGYY